jgi:hypothetical protein
MAGACSGRLARTWSTASITINDMARFPLARAIAVLTLVAGRTSPMADLEKQA